MGRLAEPLRLQGGGPQPKLLGYVKRAGVAEATLPFLLAAPRGSHRARGSIRGTAAGVMSAGRVLRRTHTHTRGGGFNRVHIPPPPPSRGLAHIFGDISRWLTAAVAGTSATGGGHRPPPLPGLWTPAGGGGGGGGRSKGCWLTPTPIARGAARRGRKRRHRPHRWSWTNPRPPQRRRAVATRAVSPPLRHTKEGTGGGGETNKAATAPYADPV